MITEIKGTLIPDRRDRNSTLSKAGDDRRLSRYEILYKTEILRGVKDFLDSPQLPILNSEETGDVPVIFKAVSAYERLGIIIPNILPEEYAEGYEDEVYLVAVLPDGWTKSPLKDSGLVNLIDSNGHARLTVEIINTSWERTAKYRLNRRFSPGINVVSPMLNEGQAEYIPVVYDGKIRQDIPQSPPILVDFTKGMEQAGQLIVDIEKKSREWLEKNYPEYNNPLMYWD